MVVKVEAVMDGGKTILPACTLEGQIIGIYTDIQKMQLIMQQLGQKGYAHHVTDGHYKRLKVEETFRFYIKMASCRQSVEELIGFFGLTKLRKKKVMDLSISQQQRIAFVRPYLYGEAFLMIEEPYHRMDADSRLITAGLIQQLVERGTVVLLLSSNLEDLLISTNDIYRIDSTGCHKMDFNEEQPTAADEEPVIKIEKIQTKKNDKTILFNPPEIDYIESLDGEILVNVAGVSYSCSLTLQELEKRLRAYGFYRCHRSYIVNLQKVREIITWTKNSYSLKLSVGGGTVVPLSRNKLSELKELIGIS